MSTSFVAGASRVVPMWCTFFLFVFVIVLVRHSCGVNVPIAPGGLHPWRAIATVSCVLPLFASRVSDPRCTLHCAWPVISANSSWSSCFSARSWCRCVERSREIHAWSHVQLYAACMTSFFGALYRQQDLSTPVRLRTTFCIIGLSSVSALLRFSTCFFMLCCCWRRECGSVCPNPDPVGASRQTQRGGE